MAVLFRLTIGVKKWGRIYRMARLDHRGASIYYIDGTPNGHHFSVHDANQNQPFGVIHSRLRRGTFKTLPGNIDIGDTITMAHIPPFSAITEPISILGDGLSTVRIDERTLHFAKELTVGRQADSIVLDADAMGDRFIGWFVLLLQPGDWDGVERWYRLRYRDFRGMRLESVHTWSRAEPWVGLGFVSNPLEG